MYINNHINEYYTQHLLRTLEILGTLTTATKNDHAGWVKPLKMAQKQTGALLRTIIYIKDVAFSKRILLGVHLSHDLRC